MRNRIYSLILLLIFGVGVVSAQNSQKGYVKTRGRLSESGELIPGKRLSETSISVKDGNAVLSDNKGDFEIALTTDEYSISDVKKQGYELVDKDILWNKYKYSTNPHTLVLDNPDNIWEDRLAVESKIRDNLYKQNQAQRAEIDRLKAENRITADEYRLLRQELSDNQSKNEQLIADMAERYSTMDFDALDELNLRISHCIINGRLVEADSLLQTKGSIHSREQELRKLQEANQQEREKVNARLKRLEKSERLATSKLEDLATDCYSKFEIFKQQHKRDSAAYYIKYRAKLDEKNIKWQLDAEKYLTHYMADYEGALAILNNCEKTINGDYNYDGGILAYVYNDFGVNYFYIMNYTKAIEYLTKALEIKKMKYGNEHETIASTYNNIGAVYRSKQDYPKALEYYIKSLDIRLQVFGEEHSITATSYNNVGEVYAQLKQFDKAIEYITKSLAIREKDITSDSELSVASCYNNLGGTYQSMRNYPQALEYYTKSLAIRVKILGEDHPDLVATMVNIGNLYYAQRKFEQALSYIKPAIKIIETFFGEEHPRIAGPCDHLGAIYMAQKNYTDALVYLNKSARINEKAFGTEHINTASSYLCIAMVNDRLGAYPEALEYYTKALVCIEKAYGENDPNVQLMKQKIAAVKSKQTK